MNWQASLADSVSAGSGDADGMNVGIDSTADVLSGGDASFSIQNLAEASSVELVDGQVAGLPAGAVEIASSIEQLNAMADANSSGMSAIGSPQSSVIVSTDCWTMQQTATNQIAIRNPTTTLRPMKTRWEMRSNSLRFRN